MVRDLRGEETRYVVAGHTPTGSLEVGVYELEGGCARVHIPGHPATGLFCRSLDKATRIAGEYVAGEGGGTLLVMDVAGNVVHEELIPLPEWWVPPSQE